MLYDPVVNALFVICNSRVDEKNAIWFLICGAKGTDGYTMETPVTWTPFMNGDILLCPD